MLTEIQTSSFNTLIQSMRLILADERFGKHGRKTNRKDLFCPSRELKAKRANAAKQLLGLLDAVLVNAVKSVELRSPNRNCLKELVKQQINVQPFSAASLTLPLHVYADEKVFKRNHQEIYDGLIYTLNQMLTRNCTADSKKDIQNIKEQAIILDVNNKVFERMEDYLKKIKIIKKPSDYEQDRNSGAQDKKSARSLKEKTRKPKKFSESWSIPEIKIDINHSIREEVQKALQMAIKNTENNLRLKSVENEIVEVVNDKISVLRNQLIEGLEAMAKQVSNQVEEYGNRAPMGKYINNFRPREFQKLPQTEVLMGSVWNSTPRVHRTNYELLCKQKVTKSPPTKLELVTEEIESLTGGKIKVTRFKN